ncbi:MAG: alanine--tRNA ligase [Alicyclobacillus sp.]|nr:alanine--tRNA ligase [Alicyclobacillus sp.]
MKPWSAEQIRNAFKDFFVQKGHLALPSASLVPHDDPTLLWINAGMAPLKPYFDGREIPECPRIVTAQKCIRTNDIENVGHTARHHTMFEMLGNFSFGDYFKREAIPWAWEFLTQVLELPGDRLSVTVHHSDDEAFQIWHEVVGIPKERIVLGDEDNFWEIGEGPCGPCSEIFYDRGEAFGCGQPTCGPGCDCDRFLEVWNLVFTQYNKEANGEYTPLPKKNIDTGMGLERISSILQDVPTNFETDLFRTIIAAAADIAGVRFGEQEAVDVSLKIIADHVRTVAFAIGDGVLPGNEGRSYIIRRLLRRAVRSGRKLGVEKPFLYRLTAVVADIMGNDYPEVRDKQAFIERVIRTEEERFLETLAEGEQLLQSALQDVKASGGQVLSGADAFRLYDTFGFPLDLTEEVAREQGVSVDRAGFEAELALQRERARAARLTTEGMNADRTALETTTVPSRFVGYEQLRTESVIAALFQEGQPAPAAGAGQTAQVILDVTPFYAESGGQVADQGVLRFAGGRADVVDVHKAPHGQHLHTVRVTEGTLQMGARVEAEVRTDWRRDIVKNHTATHLLHKALREVLGEHVAQAGSLVEDRRLRFDFSHFGALTAEELEQVEAKVNHAIWMDYPVVIEEMDLEAAQAMGAMALFGEKYGKRVRVVQAGDYSIELCGGCHVERTGVIGLFRIVSEAGIGSGVRRIEAVTGRYAYQAVVEQDHRVQQAAALLKTQPADLVLRIERLQHELQETERRLESALGKLRQGQAADLLGQVTSVQGIPVLAAVVPDTSMEGLRQMVDQLRDRLTSHVVVLGSPHDGKAQFVAAVSQDLQRRGLHAGNIVKEVAKLASGGGGGRPDLAQAGGRDPGRVDAAIGQVPAIVRQFAGDPSI